MGRNYPSNAYNHIGKEGMGTSGPQGTEPTTNSCVDGASRNSSTETTSNICWSPRRHTPPPPSSQCHLPPLQSTLCTRQPPSVFTCV